MIEHPNVFEVDGRTFVVVSPPKCGTRSFRTGLINSGFLKYPGVENVSIYHDPNLEQIFPDGLPENTSLIFTIRNPYHRARSLWRGLRTAYPRNHKLSFSSWLLSGVNMADVLYNIRINGDEYRDHFPLPANFSTMSDLYHRYVDHYSFDEVHCIRLESRIEDFNKIGIGQYLSDGGELYKTNPDNVDDIDYYNRNPEVREIVEYLFEKDFNLFEYTFDDMVRGFGVVDNYRQPERDLKEWYGEFYNQRVRVLI